MAIEASPQPCLCLLCCGGSLGQVPYVPTTPGVRDAGSGLSEGPGDGGLLPLERAASGQAPCSSATAPRLGEWLCESLPQSDSRLWAWPLPGALLQ